jgi:glutathione synthase/RimK-type ligase-like ATP-grasp enzyme
MQFVSNPDQELLRVAERTQEVIGGEINFIDIFRTRSGRWILSEINTACNLSIHEGMARQAGHPSWNIANAIAKYLDRQARGMHGYY